MSRRPVLAGTLLSVMAVAAPLLPAQAVRAVEPPPGQAAAVEVIVEGIAPAVLKPGSTLTIRGTVLNRGTAPLSAGEMSLDLRRRPFTNRADMVALADNRTPLREAAPVARVGLGEEVAPGAKAAWKLVVKVKDLRLPGNGVYPIAVNLRAEGVAAEASGGLPSSSAARTLDTQTTFLPYVPERAGYTPTRVSWLWPLLGEPVREPDGVFAKDAGSRFASGSRLADLAAAPGKRPVAWFLDPQLLDDAAALAITHRRRTGEEVARTPGDKDAAAWISSLRQQLTGKPVAATPYADSDLRGLIGAGADVVVERALGRARAVTSTAFGRESDTAVVWPPGGVADMRTLGALRRLGAKTVVLSSDQFPVLGTLSYTPTGRARVATANGDLEVLIADAGLTRVLDRDLRAPGVFALAQQQLLAETALITLERPNAPRAILMSPPRRWDPPTLAAKRLLDAFAAAPWISSARLASLSQTRVPAELVGTEIDNRPAVDARKLSGRHVGDVLAAARDADSIAGVLVERGRLVEDHETAVLRAASSSWIGNGRARDYVRGVRQWVRSDLGKVKVIGRDLVTMSGSRGTIPITVSNGLSQAIAIRPTIVPLISGRLRARSPELLTIAPGRKKEVRIPAEAGVNGITRVAVELRDAEGNRYGEAIFLRVNVTNFGSVGLIVVLGGGGLLFAVAIARNIRRIRRHRARGRGGSQTTDRAAEDRSENVEEPVQL